MTATVLNLGILEESGANALLNKPFVPWKLLDTLMQASCLWFYLSVLTVIIDEQVQHAPDGSKALPQVQRKMHPDMEFLSKLQIAIISDDADNTAQHLQDYDAKISVIG